MLLSLQYLRGLAALMIVYFHALGPLERVSGKQLSPLLSSYGVDLFFVISGMVMWLSTYRKGIGPYEFIINRFSRIAPLYWTMTICVSAIALVAPNLLRSTEFNLDHVLASLAFIPWPNPKYPGFTPVIIPGWSLNLEMFFYAIFAITLAFMPWLRFAGTVLTLGLLALIGFIARPSGIWGFYTNPIILEFALGVLVGVLYTSSVIVPVFVAIMMFMGGLALCSMLHAYEAVPQIISAGLPSMMIVAGLALFEKRSRVKEIALLCHLGDTSYALYLSHPITLAAGAILLGRLSIGNYLPWQGILAFYVFSSVCAGSAVYFAVERPLTRLVRSMIKRKKMKRVTAVVR
jgi:exopolysaccharide production protein ExoZ